MSTPKLGEFFTALTECALERCEQATPHALRRELGALLHLTVAYAPREWGEQARRLGSDGQARSLLLAQLDHHLSALKPDWLDRAQLRSLLQASLRLLQASWDDRHELRREACHVFGLNSHELFEGELSSVASIAPHLHAMMTTRAWLARNRPQRSAALCPFPSDLEPLTVLERRDEYWSVLCEREGLRLIFEARAYQDPQEASAALASLEEKHHAWEPLRHVGTEGAWVWQERTPSLHLGLLTQRHEPISAEHALLALRPVLRALSELHERGEVCGALRPSALVVSPEGEVKLGERLLWARHGRLPSRLEVSDVGYWAPELFEEGARFTPQSDLWAFGLTLYELLCGPLPWSGQRRPDRLLRAIKRADLRAWSRVPQELSSFVSRCLSPDPKQRWMNATQALERLEALAERLSPLLKGQRLGAQWVHVMSTNALQRFVEQRAILPESEPELELARFLSEEREEAFEPAQLSPLFPKLTELHQRWWSNQALTEETIAQQRASLSTFKESLTELDPAFLFEQLTILSQQKETLERRYQESLTALAAERAELKSSLKAHGEAVLKRLWQTLGLPQDLLPKWSEPLPKREPPPEPSEVLSINPDEVERAAEELREVVHSLAPAERLERLDELSARKRLIESSRPLSIPIPEASLAPHAQVLLGGELPLLDDDELAASFSDDELSIPPRRPAPSLRFGPSPKSAVIVPPSSEPAHKSLDNHAPSVWERDSAEFDLAPQASLSLSSPPTDPLALDEHGQLPRNPLSMPIEPQDVEVSSASRQEIGGREVMDEVIFSISDEYERAPHQALEGALDEAIIDPLESSLEHHQNYKSSYALSTSDPALDELFERPQDLHQGLDQGLDQVFNTETELPLGSELPSMSVTNAVYELDEGRAPHADQLVEAEPLNEVGSGEVGLSEVGLSEVGLSEVGLGEVGLGEVGLSERARDQELEEQPLQPISPSVDPFDLSVSRPPTLVQLREDDLESLPPRGVFKSSSSLSTARTFPGHPYEAEGRREPEEPQDLERAVEGELELSFQASFTPNTSVAPFEAPAPKGPEGGLPNLWLDDESTIEGYQEPQAIIDALERQTPLEGEVSADDWPSDWSALDAPVTPEEDDE